MPLFKVMVSKEYVKSNTLVEAPENDMKIKSVALAIILTNDRFGCMLFSPRLGIDRETGDMWADPLGHHDSELWARQIL